MDARKDTNAGWDPLKMCTIQAHIDIQHQQVFGISDLTVLFPLWSGISQSPCGETIICLIGVAFRILLNQHWEAPHDVFLHASLPH